MEQDLLIKALQKALTILSDSQAPKKTTKLVHDVYDQFEKNDVEALKESVFKLAALAKTLPPSQARTAIAGSALIAAVIANSYSDKSVFYGNIAVEKINKVFIKAEAAHIAKVEATIAEAEALYP